MGKRIRVRFPFYHEEGIIVIMSRRKRSPVIETREPSNGVFNCHDMELVEVLDSST